MPKVKVAVNGYGTIGKRIADMVSIQDDMEVIGVSKIHPNFEALIAKNRKYPLYTKKENINNFKNINIEVEGTIEDMVNQADIVIDCTPEKIGEKNKEIYDNYDVKVIWQGGENKNIATKSFNSISNYEQVYGEQYARVVSCNTTGICRLLYLLDKEYCIKKTHVSIIRRSVDLKNITAGPIDSIVFNPIVIPSHHAFDVNTILPHIDIVTTSVKVPTTFMHAHIFNIELKKKEDVNNIKCFLSSQSRIKLIDNNITSTSEIIEYNRDLLRPRNDVWENCIFSNSFYMSNNSLYLYQTIHQESIVIPENIDCIRSMMKLENKYNSIKKTDDSLLKFNQM